MRLTEGGGGERDHRHGEVVVEHRDLDAPILLFKHAHGHALGHTHAAGIRTPDLARKGQLSKHAKCRGGYFYIMNAAVIVLWAVRL